MRALSAPDMLSFPPEPPPSEPPPPEVVSPITQRVVSPLATATSASPVAARCLLRIPGSNNAANGAVGNGIDLYRDHEPLCGRLDSRSAIGGRTGAVSHSMVRIGGLATALLTARIRQAPRVDSGHKGIVDRSTIRAKAPQIFVIADLAMLCPSSERYRSG